MHRLRTSLLALVVGALAALAIPSAAAAAEPAVEPAPTLPLRQDVSEHLSFTVTRPEDCRGFCIFQERGWTSPVIAARAPKTNGFDVACNASSFTIAHVALENFRQRLSEISRFGPSRQLYHADALLNYSSVINHCPFPVQLVREAKEYLEPPTFVTISPGQWVWDLGAPPWRINDRVEDVRAVS